MYLTTRQLTSLLFLRVVTSSFNSSSKLFYMTSNLSSTLLGNSSWDAVDQTGRTLKHQ